MQKRFPPINPNFPHMLHGGDYNPDQWISTPAIWDEDVRLLKLAHCNVVSVGIFSWSALEPIEGEFQFGWLDTIFEKMSKAKVGIVLATPTGAKPNWMAKKYPEIRRCLPDGTRELQHHRHNHCYTSPLYREKTTIINTKLAERYGGHPSLVMWHLSNEYGGECYCPLCKSAFRNWLKNRYKTLDALNEAYWSRFWSHTYTDWEQVDAIDISVHALCLDWKRFVTDQMVDYMRHEIVPLKKISPTIPVTTNMMGTYPGLNYWKFAPHLDVVSWDAYPQWHGDQSDAATGRDFGFYHDLNRSLKQKPFVLMESTPSCVNWQGVSPLKRPGMHRLSSLQAVAHGSDSVMYFQWRKSRGSFEKFHGAVVDHVGNEQTRTFKDVAELGAELETLGEVVGTSTPAEVALIFDWENRWAIEAESGPRNLDKDYVQTCIAHYEPFWKRGIPVDVIDMDQPLDKYKLVVAPMLYLLRPGVAERIALFVEQGGTLITTYMTGYVNESDLCFLTGFPGPLRKVVGIWAEELDAVPAGKTQGIRAVSGNELKLTGDFSARQFCELIHAESARVIATYATDFYANRPAATVNEFGKGRAYHIASRNEERFIDDFSSAIIQQLSLRRAIATDLPPGVTATVRSDGAKEWVFVMNFNDAAVKLSGPEPMELPPFGLKILSRQAAAR